MRLRVMRCNLESSPIPTIPTSRKPATTNILNRNRDASKVLIRVNLSRKLVISSLDFTAIDSSKSTGSAVERKLSIPTRRSDFELHVRVGTRRCIAGVGLAVKFLTRVVGDGQAAGVAGLGAAWTACCEVSAGVDEIEVVGGEGGAGHRSSEKQGLERHD